MRKVLVTVSAVVALAMLAACGGGEEGAGGSVGADEDIVIGTQVPLTGPASFVGQGFKVGAELAAAEINENGGVNGHDLVLKFVDDKGTPDGGVAAVRQLVGQDEVLAVLGGSTSTATVAAVPFFRQNGAVYYVSLASDPRVLEQFNENIFVGATISQADGVKTYAQYIKDEVDAQTVAIMECDQAHCTAGTPLLEESLDELGIDVVANVTFNSGDTDFTGQISEVKEANPDAVFIYGLAADGGRIIPQVRRAGIDVPLFADTSLADPSVAEVAGESAEGFTAFWLGGTQFLSDETGDMADWLASLNEHVKDLPEATPNLYSLMAYSDVYVLAEAMRQAGDDLTPETVAEKLQTGIDGFVAGKDENWDFAVPIALPRTFTTDDHQGNRTVTPIVVQDGSFVTAE